MENKTFDEENLETAMKRVSQKKSKWTLSARRKESKIPIGS